MEHAKDNGLPLINSAFDMGGHSQAIPVAYLASSMAVVGFLAQEK